ncbi:MAG: zinc ribbon domain-containing protein [Candidatus Thorarchaeota archaeon]
MVRNCEKCGKANQPTRKFCIRCGASLIKPPKKAAPVPEPAVAQPAAPPVAENPPPAETLSTSTDDTWVKPSEVSKDRVRHGGDVGRPKSEMEKAMEAFAKAETVGIDEEDGSGVIETRMLRASEVKELLEGPGMMAGGEEIPPPTMMDGSEPLPPEAADMMMPQAGPTASQIEESILGSKSAYVEKPVEPEPEPIPEPVTLVSSAEFAEGEAPVLEAVTVEEPVATVSDTGFAAATPPVQPEPVAPAPTPAPAAPTKQLPDSEVDLVIACPDCGKVINVDMFEYPNEVYSKMGAARLNHARICIVQGKNDDAMKQVRMARAMYEKADDKKGLKEVLKLVESLAKG